MASDTFQENNFSWKVQIWKTSDEDEKEEGRPILPKAPLTQMHKSVFLSVEKIEAHI